MQRLVSRRNERLVGYSHGAHKIRIDAVPRDRSEGGLGGIRGQIAAVIARSSWVHGLRPRLATLGIAALVVAGCTSSRGCTSAGYASSVGVLLPSSEWTLSEFCVDDDCLGRFQQGQRHETLVDDDPEDHTYRLVAVDPEGVVVRHAGEVRTESYWINGKGCEPRTANATLAIGHDGRITVRHP